MKKKILIINLRRLGDVYTTAHLINSLSCKEEVEISILVYKESAKAAKNLLNIHQTFVIDREEIITVKNNKLFTDSSALDLLATSLDAVKKEQWDQVVNFSNDTVGAYLCSYLNNSTQNTIGVHFNNNRNVVANSVWEIIFNDVLTTVKYSPIHFVDCYHHMLKTPPEANGNKLITKEEHDQNAFENITLIREQKGSNQSSVKVIAIQATTSNASKNIPGEVLSNYIELLLRSDNLVPVLLIAPTNEERLFADNLVEKFNDNLVVIEADLTALTSVLRYVDLVVTPDTVTKHISDLIDTPVLEISLGGAPFLKQGSFRAGSLILTDLISNRTYSRNDSTITNITANDMLASTFYIFSNRRNLKPTLSLNVTLYSVSKDSTGTTYVPTAGTINGAAEIERIMSRQFINSLIDGNGNVDITGSALQYGTVAINDWCQKEKGVITDTMKDLLGTLRALLQGQESKRNSRDFVISLGKLITHAETNSVAQIATIIFKTKLESINARTFEENAKEVEVLLYELKANLQKNLNSIKELEDKAIILKKEEFVQRNNHSID